MYKYVRTQSVCLGIVIILILFFSLCRKNSSNNLIVLYNDHIEVGILPEVGGRVVLLRALGMKNILKSDQWLWNNPNHQKPEISAFSDFKAFNGHIVWVGPQSEWWCHQDINETRRNGKAVWPPDPYLIYGRYVVIDNSDTHIQMVGPESPVSGVRLVKDISIDSTDIVTFTVRAENIREENVSWDLWMNTRFDGFARGYVPIDENGILEFVKSKTKMSEVTPYKIEGQFFTFCPSLPEKPKIEQVQEVHLYPSAGFIAGFSKQQMLLIRFEKLDKNMIHQEHGLVELYSYVNDVGDDSLLELEVHSAYCTLTPGETMSFTETWELLPYYGKTSTEEHIQFLQNFLK